MFVADGSKKPEKPEKPGAVVGAGILRREKAILCVCLDPSWTDPFAAEPVCFARRPALSRLVPFLREGSDFLR
jgi:hypothetical protein